MITRLVDYAGLAAYLNGGVGVLGAILLITFFAVGQPFGTLSDIAAIPWALAFIPVMFALYQYSRGRAPTLSRIGLILGVLGVLGVLVFQTLLILGSITFSQELPYINASFGLIGLWLLIVNRPAAPGPMSARGLARFGLVIGALWVVANIFSWIGGFPTIGDSATFNFSDMNPITLLAFTMLYIAYLLQPIWALWLGRVLTSNKAG